MHRIFFVLALIFWVVGAEAQESKPMLLPVDPQLLEFETQNGRASFEVEIANSGEARMRGLMWRRDFPSNRAMLFVFGRMNEVLMWMQNTPSPLDMVFLDDKGRVTSIHENAVPFSEDIISSQGPAAYVVEVLAGTVKSNGIKIGDRAIHRIICGECRH